jgi:septum formation protein
MPPLVLGSTSPFRRALLERLQIPFTVDAPQTDEARLPGESADALVLRLAAAKARDVATRHPGALVIGSDQVAVIGDTIAGKPGNRENAIAQLTAASGRAVVFHTGLCLVNGVSGRMQSTVEHFTVRFRSLDRGQIERYVEREQPFDCAGSFKSEGYGITLFSALEGRDPNCLIGLPLIRLIEMLSAEGIVLP